MIITVLTLFPELFAPYFSTSILGRAAKKGLVQYKLVNIREFGEGKHQIVDDRPFGGGPGMLFKADIMAKALKSVIGTNKATGVKIVLTTPSGTPYQQTKAQELSKIKHLIIICGHYEGVDQRFIDHYVDEEISIGDYVLTGGELAALVVADSVVRLIPEVLKKEEATLQESFADNLLEYPHYTHPAEFEGEKVPEILLSGNHAKIAEWKHQKSLEKTKKARPDLLKKALN